MISRQMGIVFVCEFPANGLASVGNLDDRMDVLEIGQPSFGLVYYVGRPFPTEGQHPMSYQ